MTFTSENSAQGPGTVENFMLLTVDGSKCVSGKFKMDALGTHEKGIDNR